MSDKLKLKGHMKAFMRWPLILSALLIVLNIWVYFVSVKAGIIVSGGILIYVGCAVIILRCHRPFIVNELIAFANQYDSLEKRILEELALPYAIMDMNGRMIWSNKVFAELTGKDQFYKKNVSTVFPDVTADKLPVADKKETAEISTRFGEKTYRISMQRVSLGEVVAKSEFLENSNRNASLIAMYLYDDTELKSYIKKNEDNKLVVALAYLDNYEEALESVEDVRRSLLIALIDRKITKYFSNFDGLVKKLEKDKYFLIMRQSSLEALKEQRFHILDEVKTVNIGNEMAITLSIGVGLNASTYIQNYEYSRIAIEMALGRGGDQVVIKNGNNITYYGGKTQQMEKNTRVKARVKAQALKEFMSTKDRVVVMGHKITDVDALGAAIGIFRAGKTLGKSVSIVVNDPTKSIRPLIAGYVNNPDYEPSMFVDSEQAKDMVDNNTVVVVVDTNRPSYTECEELLHMTKTIVVLDHHRRGSEVIENAVLSYVEPYASSACEMVAEILQYFSDDLRIRNMEADCLYAGIMIDWVDYLGTKRFAHESDNLKLMDPNEMNEKFPMENFPVSIRMEIVKRNEEHQEFPVTEEDKEKLIHGDKSWEYGVKVSIRDFGTGIDKESILNIAKVGNSRRREHYMIKDMPEWLKPTAEFGIGLQSAFILTDTFKCDTFLRSGEKYEITFSSVKSAYYEGYINVRP